MVVNDYACSLAIRGALEFIASKLAPALLDQAIDAGIANANAGPDHRKSQMAFTVIRSTQNRETLLIASTRYLIAILSLSDSSR